MNVEKKIEGLKYNVLKKMVADFEIKTPDLKKATIIPAIVEFFKNNPDKEKEVFADTTPSEKTKAVEANSDKSTNNNQETKNNELERIAVLHIKDPSGQTWKDVMRAVHHYDNPAYFNLMRKGDSNFARQLAKKILSSKLA